MTAIIFVAGFFLLATFFNSVMDALENKPNFDESIFRSLNKKFWLKEVSWEYCKTILGYHIDAWHLAKSLMVICLVGSLVSAVWAGATGSIKMDIISISEMVAILGVIWNLGFTLFYHGLFKVR
jgi:hypothetical protein